MSDILHRVGIQATPQKVFEALSTQEGISSWWTSKVKVQPEVGSVMEMRFKNDSLIMHIQIEELNPPIFLKWRVLAGPPEWIGSTINFLLKLNGNETVVLFAHRGWKEQVDFMHHCSTKWGYYMFSLKALLEEGKGTPHPDELPASSWG